MKRFPLFVVLQKVNFGLLGGMRPSTRSDAIGNGLSGKFGTKVPKSFQL